MASIQNRNNGSEIFAIVQQISSQINKDRMQEVVDRANSLDIKDKQLVVDLLAMALEKNHHILNKADRVLLLLTKIASSASILARNRILNSEHITQDAEQSPDVYTIPGESLVHVRVVRRGRRDTLELFNECLITWAHLSHTNVLPLYGIFLEGEDGPISLVVPQTTKGNIIDYTATLSQASRMLVISDVIDGLYYLHHLNVVHGGLNPESVFISDSDRACITDLDAFNAEDSGVCSVRYLAPEMLKDEGEDPVPTRAADMWSLGCLIYEVLVGKVPFYQYRQERKVFLAILKGKQPSRPSSEGSEATEIKDIIWQPLSTCWEFQAEGRPTCLQFQKAFSGVMTIHDNRRLALKSRINQVALENTKGLSFNLDVAQSSLTKILGSDFSMSTPPQTPLSHFQKRLSKLVDDVATVEVAAKAVVKLSPNDAQTLLDALDLLWEASPSFQPSFSPMRTLAKKIMLSARLVPQRYKVHRIRYDPASLVEARSGKGYKGLDLDVCVSVVTNSGDVSSILERLPSWAHLSHTNILPLYGVFYDNVDEIPRLSLIVPYLKNGRLCDYAPRLPQRDRIPLINDIVNAQLYLQGLNFYTGIVRGDHFLISDERRALCAAFVPDKIQTLFARTVTIHTPGSYVSRFYAPEHVTNDKLTHKSSVWSFGCLVYELLSGKPPYHQYPEENEIRLALSRKEVPERPKATEHNVDEIDDKFWDLIMGCWKPDQGDRLSLSEIQMLLRNMLIQDDRPKVHKLPGAEVLTRRFCLDIDWERVEYLLDQIQVELLQTPLSKLIRNYTKHVAASAVKFDPNDVQVLVDFLDLTLKNHITLSDERNRVLALLSRITTLTHVFPNRFKLNGIKYHSLPIAEGGFRVVHRGDSDPSICVKVMTKVDSRVLMGFVKELVLWAHSSHPNVLPFYGVFVDEMKRICLVSPFMNKGNLHDYAPRLAQNKRIPLLHDVVKGLIYLHGLGVVHTNLKGENVLISDEGRGLITDFGASHVITATAKGGPTTASVASTLRFTPPEIVLNRHVWPTQECDIWSLGCLFYEVFSCKLPYFEYKLEAQIISALMRGQLPTRPDTPDDNNADEQEQDWDEIDDAAWSVILSCWALRPEDRPKASRVEELIANLKIWDDRAGAKNTSGTQLVRSRSGPAVDLNRAGDLLNELEGRFLGQRALRCSTEDFVLVLSKANIGSKDKWLLLYFWSLAFNQRLFSSDEKIRVLALLSALMSTFWTLPHPYNVSTPMTYNRVLIGSGSFGTLHQGSDPIFCVKVINFATIDPNIRKEWFKAIPPLVHLSHPNILPSYGAFTIKRLGCLVSPFVRSGNVCKYTLRLLQTARVLLILDIIEAIMYLHSLGVVHGNLKGENILISDEGRALVADFRPYHVNMAAAGSGPTGPFVTSTLRFSAPELIKDSAMLPTTKSDVWSIGCLIFLVLSRQVPFNKYSQDADIRSALSRGEIPERPVVEDSGADAIDDAFWSLITRCYASEPADRPGLLEIRKFLVDLNIQDSRPPPNPLPGDKITKPGFPNPGIDIDRIRDILDRIEAQLPQDEEGQDEN